MNAINVLNKIKEYADEFLKIYMLVDSLKRQLLNKFYSRSKSKNKCSPKRNSALNLVHTLIQTQNTQKEDAVVQCPARFANSENVGILYCTRPSTSKIRDCSPSENGTVCVKTMTEELCVKDKDITARTENRDIGLNVSLPKISVCESGTQYVPKQLRELDTVVDRRFKEKISVATQIREPTSICVIKSNNNEDILKSDKGTCVRDAYVLASGMTNVDKDLKNMCQKNSRFRKYYDEFSHPCVSHVREKEVNCTDYSSSLFLPNKNYRYKSSLPCNSDRTRANIPDFELSLNQRTSRIPLYAKSRRYPRNYVECPSHTYKYF